MATQASWIRTLLATYVKKWESGRSGIGGLFGAPLRSHDPVLPWTRAQQAAFLIFMGKCFRDAVKRTHATWAKDLRKVQAHLTKNTDPAFEGDYSLINTDQGIRGLLHVTNCEVTGRCSVKGVAHPGDFNDSESVEQTESRRSTGWTSMRMREAAHEVESC
ncbi:MAG TPA: hypothetical protein VGC73_15130 [Pyrinomonadaceae bacterium]